MDSFCRSLSKALLLTVVFCLTISTAYGQGDTAMATLDDFAFLAGRWEGTAFGDRCIEDWREPIGGSILATYTQFKGDQISFYELVTITIEDGLPILKIKHFNADLTAWEEKDEIVSFPFVEVGDNYALFDGLEYRVTGDTLDITLAIGHSDGSVHHEKIICRRVQ